MSGKYIITKRTDVHTSEAIHSISCELEQIMRATQNLEGESRKTIIECVSAARNALAAVAYGYDKIVSLYIGRCDE